MAIQIRKLETFTDLEGKLVLMRNRREVGSIIQRLEATVKGKETN